jgi:acyl-CoA hydrolase
MPEDDHAQNLVAPQHDVAASTRSQYKTMLTTKTKAAKLVTDAKTLAPSRITSANELDAFVETLRDHLPASIIVAK